MGQKLGVYIEFRYSRVNRIMRVKVIDKTNNINVLGSFL